VSQPGPERDDRTEVERLLARIKESLSALEQLRASLSDHWGYEDPVYRFYHQSYKVFELQARTMEVVERLKALAPGRPLNAWFLEIVAQGTGKTFELQDNRRWLPVTRPIVEAFFHARFLLEMTCKYGRELEAPPALMPSGWAAVLYLYNLR
jgi:hypothetical protein